MSTENEGPKTETSAQTPATPPVTAAPKTTPVLNEPPMPPAETPVQMTELDMLKKRAGVMGINFSNNIGVEALKEKINEKLNAEASAQAAAQKAEEEKAEAEKAEQVAQEAPAPDAPNPLDPEPVVTTPKQKKLTARQRIWAENMRLVRVRITNMDPKKANLPGEIITVANEFLGTVSKFIPFGEATDNGYHIPFVLLKALQRRKFVQIREKKNGPGNTPQVEERWVREFAIEILDPLTTDELNRLKMAQLAAGTVEDAA